MTNSLARQRPALFAGVYASAPGQEANGMLSEGAPQVPEREHFLRAQADVIARLSKAGVI